MKGFIFPVLLATVLVSCMSPKTEEVKDMDANGWVRTKGTLVNGHREGYFEDYDKNGVLLEASYWHQGYRDGNFKEYYPSGSVKAVGIYVQGQLDGPFESYDSLGNSSWVIYNKGVKTGVEELKDKTKTITDKIYYSEGGQALYQEKLGVLEDVKERILFPVNGDNDDVLKIGVANAFTVYLAEPPKGKVTMVIGREGKNGEFIPTATGTSKDNQKFVYIFKPSQSGPGILSFKMKHSKALGDMVSVDDEVYHFQYEVE